MDIVPMTRTYDYPYFNLRLTWGEVEAEEYRVRVLKGRAACSRGGPALHDGGGAGFINECTRKLRVNYGVKMTLDRFSRKERRA